MLELVVQVLDRAGGGETLQTNGTMVELDEDIVKDLAWDAGVGRKVGVSGAVRGGALVADSCAVEVVDACDDCTLHR